MIEKVKESVSFLKNSGFDHPEIGIILGTGLGSLVEEIDILAEVDYDQIPHFPLATVEFHKGKLIYGELSGKKVVAMLGRFHFYEGYEMWEVVFPVRVMKFLGISSLLVSNASGNMNLGWNKGELMLINDHINLQPANPLIGNGASDFGNIFVDMSSPYDEVMNKLLTDIASKQSVTLREGVYASVPGPNLETRAEYRYLRNSGADAVGMSTVPEIIAANQMELPVSAISVLTDDCDPDNLQPVEIEDIIETARIAEKDLVILIKELLKSI